MGSKNTPWEQHKTLTPLRIVYRQRRSAKAIDTACWP